MLDVEIGESRQLVTLDAGMSASAPAWSPDGGHIAFHAESDGTWGVYVMPVEGGELVKVSD